MSSFHLLIENLPHPIFFTTIDGIVTYANKSFQQFSGYSQEECENHHFIDFVAIESHRDFLKLLETLKGGIETQQLILNFTKKDGRQAMINVCLSTERSDKKIDSFSGYLDTIFTSQHVTSSGIIPEFSRLAEIEERYKTLYDLTFEGIIIHRRGITIDANPAFEKMIGYRRDEFLGVNIVDLCVLPEDHHIVIDAMKNDVSQPYEVKARRKDGTIIHTEVESRWTGLKDDEIRVTAIRDITSRKQAENQLKESEERYKLLSNITFEGIFLHNNGVIIDANQSLANMIGYELDEIVGRNIIQLVVLPEYHKRVADALRNEETTPYEVMVKRKDGSLFFAEVEAGMVNYHGEWLRVTAARDVTWRKEAEKKLRENEEELDTFFSQSGDGFFIMKMEAPVRWDETVDKEKALDQVLKGMYLTKVNSALISQYKTKAETIEGYTFEQLFHWNDIFGRKFVRELLEDGAIKFEMAEPRFDNSIMWIEGNYVVLYDESGWVRGCCGVRREVSDRKKVEEEIKKHNEELKKANQELDNFVYRVSHDLKAPISSAKGLIHIARLETETERIGTCLELIETSMDKLDSFILDILDYSRNSRIGITSEPINFDDLIKDTLSNTQYLQQEKNMRIELDIKDEIRFFSDKRRLVFIFNNLISNAIRFSDEQKSESYLIISVEVTEQQANVTFADNGIGIKPEHIDHIFGMFYRANEDRAGSGLGLYIVKEVIDKLHGTIEVSSEFTKGTTFNLTIPNLPG